MLYHTTVYSRGIVDFRLRDYLPTAIYGADLTCSYKSPHTALLLFNTLRIDPRRGEYFA